MFTSAITENTVCKICRRYIFVTSFCFFFVMVYQVFSHNVWSPFMAFAPAILMFLGVLPFELLKKAGQNALPPRVCVMLYNFGVAALTVGSVLRGVFDIYGTASALVKYYLFCGAAAILCGLILWPVLKSFLKKEG